MRRARPLDAVGRADAAHTRERHEAVICQCRSPNHHESAGGLDGSHQYGMWEYRYAELYSTVESKITANDLSYFRSICPRQIVTSLFVSENTLMG